MTLSIKVTALSLLLLSTGSDAFSPAALRFGVSSAHAAYRARPLPTPLHAAASLDQEQPPADDEVTRLRNMAAQLRNEVATLEQSTAQEMAQAAEKAFRKFDINRDGKITLQELKAGLEKALKLELSEVRVQKLLERFDTNGDGALQVDEFVGVDRFRNTLDQITRQEKQESRVAQQQEVAAKQAETQLAAISEAINEKEPSNVEKAVSVLPYLFPLLDSVQFGAFLLSHNQDNPLVQGLAVLFGLYRSIPFGAFIAYFALSTLGDNLAINKLIRFNLKQSIYLDISLFFPSILASLGALAANNISGFDLPQGITEMGADAVFVTMLLAIGYSVVSSLSGEKPDKIPFISDAVSQRMPSLDMFDDQGRFIPQLPKEEDDKKDD